MNNLEFARELHKTFIVLGQDVRMTLGFLKMFPQSGVNHDLQ